ncbi:hypothetical protein BDQ17DRAFT_1322121 [Cyathus striatus]|nr:hypothetical protein BDQ17DRAFT_1322121 [Cyathus striatus]
MPYAETIESGRQQISSNKNRRRRGLAGHGTILGHQSMRLRAVREFVPEFGSESQHEEPLGVQDRKYIVDFGRKDERLGETRSTRTKMGDGGDGLRMLAGR